MKISVENWNGEKRDLFCEVIKEVFDYLIDDVVIHVPHGRNADLVEDGKFHIHIWSSPEGDKSIEPPKKIWDVKVDCRDDAFDHSGKGIKINDGDYSIAELIRDKNLFIHHDICHQGTVQEMELLRKILRKVIKILFSVEMIEEAYAKLSTSKKIERVLESNFVFTNEMSRILSLAFTGEKNAIIFGPGGHGKSAMVKTVIDELRLNDDTFFQFFGEGMDESRLFGGLNFKRLEEDKVLEYYPEKSFLNSRVAVFEELFDAPASVLLALKDVLTAKELRNGSQRFQMKTELIIVLTNRNPEEISELSPAAHALVERFPLQLDLQWASYSSESYLAMFNKVAGRMEGPVLNGSTEVLADIIAKATAEGNFVSPRTAIHAYETVQSAAKIRGDDKVCHEDFADLRFIVGMSDIGEEVKDDIKKAQIRVEAQTRLDRIDSRYSNLEDDLSAAKTATQALQFAKRLSKLEDELADIRIPDSLVKKRDRLARNISNRINRAKSLAMDYTSI